ncbi:MAG: glycogen synthase [Chloroflexota bacterium]
MSSPLRILFLAAEASPLVKVGGLADVAGSLPAVLRELGNDIRVVLPLHPSLRELTRDATPIARFPIPTQFGAEEACAFRLTSKRFAAPLYLIDGPPLRGSDTVYHSYVEQDFSKYIFFSRAALELARAIDWKPTVVHANDWHTAAAVYWVQTAGRSDPFFADVATLIAIHNLPYLGDGAANALAQYGFPPSNHPLLPDWARDALLPLALAHADMITAVSPTYAAEIQTPEFGCGVEQMIRARADHVRGILNGLDPVVWDPARDKSLGARFDATTLNRRARNKRALQKQFGLAQSSAPLLGIVARLDHQKGLDIALPALASWADHGGQTIVLGTGNPDLEQHYRELAVRAPARSAVALKFDARLANQIYGGADLLLMPSRYEPCGLSQMIAMRYGCIPVVRAVGGLRDTVRDVARGRGTGFVFFESTPEAIIETLQRAQALFVQPRRWQVVQRRAMRQDFSWRTSARAYVAAYRRAITFHNSTHD